MSPNRLRKLIMGAAIAALIGWYGLTYWQPAESLAVDDDQVAESKEELADLAGFLAGAESELASAQGGVGQAAAEVTDWPANPFFHAAQANQAADASESDVAADDVREQPAAEEALSFVLSGIVGGDPPMAIIDGEVVRVGDEIGDGVHVASIGELSVTLRQQKRTRVLRLPE